MSGVTTGTRLERLYELRRQVAIEIMAEERRVLLDDRGEFRASKPEAKRSPNVVDVTLADLGVTANEVREWARAAGLAVAGRGRIGWGLVEAYVEAHQAEQVAS